MHATGQNSASVHTHLLPFLDFLECLCTGYYMSTADVSGDVIHPQLRLEGLGPETRLDLERHKLFNLL